MLEEGSVVQYKKYKITFKLTEESKFICRKEKIIDKSHEDGAFVPSPLLCSTVRHSPIEKSVCHSSNQTILSKPILSPLRLHVEMAEILHQFSFCEVDFHEAS